jgi:hypothetical protein
MSDKAYRVTNDPKWLKLALKKAEHLIVKDEHGGFTCRTHNCDPKQCAPTNDGDIVWQNSLDGGKYVVAVVRLKPYHGYLTVTRDDKTVLAREVGISYNAPYGPDAEDVREWKQLCEEAVDRDYLARGETPPGAP